MHKAHDFADLAPLVTVTIEVPRGALIKRDAHGRIDLISPVPAPFNYGRIDDILGGDGEPRDAVVLGPRLPRDSQHRLRTRGVVRFLDGGLEDHKWVCSHTPPTRRQVVLLRAFFSFYASLKCARDVLKLRRPSSRYAGWHPTTPT